MLYGCIMPAPLLPAQQHDISSPDMRCCDAFTVGCRDIDWIAASTPWPDQSSTRTRARRSMLLLSSLIIRQLSCCSRSARRLRASSVSAMSRVRHVRRLCFWTSLRFMARCREHTRHGTPQTNAVLPTIVARIVDREHVIKCRQRPSQS